MSSSPPEMHRLGVAVLEQRRAVVLVELELGVAAVGEVAEERGRELGEVGPERGVELGAEIGQGAVELLVQRELARGRGRFLLPRGPLLRGAARPPATASAAALLSPLARASASSASCRSFSAAAAGVASRVVRGLAVAELGDARLQSP